MNLIGYVRVSRVMGRAGDSFISPADQRARIEAWCNAHGHALIDVHTDLDESGGKTDRPEFQRALARCESGEAGGIVVAKLDRFARSVAGAAATIQRLDAAGCQLVSVAEGIDTTGPSGRLMRTILFAFAEFERERLTESWRTARASAAERGVHSGRVAPVGYRKGDDGRLQPASLPERAAVVAAYEARAAGSPWSAIARQLAGVAGRQWPASSVQSMIRNRVYLGELHDGPYVNPQAHEPLVGRALFEAANAARSQSSPRSGDGHLLAGMIRCASCLHAMGGGHKRQRNGRRFGYYACKRMHGSGRCECPATINASVVEPLVEAAFLAHHAGAAAEQVPADVAPLERSLDDAEAELAAYVEVMRATDPGFRAGYDQRAKAIDEARAELAEVAAPAPAFAGVTLRDYWPDATTAERRELLAADIAAVLIGRGDERVRIVWSGEPITLPTRGRPRAAVAHT